MHCTKRTPFQHTWSIPPCSLGRRCYAAAVATVQPAASHVPQSNMHWLFRPHCDKWHRHGGVGMCFLSFWVLVFWPSESGTMLHDQTMQLLGLIKWSACYCPACLSHIVQGATKDWRAQHHIPRTLLDQNMARWLSHWNRFWFVISQKSPWPRWVLL